MQIVIHHNPKCSKSRDVLRVVEAAGYAPTVIRYLDTGWSVPQLQRLFAAAGLTAAEALRPERGLAKELGLLEDNTTETDILNAMVEHPHLVERPIVCTPKGVAICRPVGRVLDLLEDWPAAPFAKSNGDLLIDTDGNPVPGR